MRSPVDVQLIQRRTVHTLVGTQVMAGLGVSSGVAVAVLLASNVLGRPDLAGFVQSAQVLGSALLALPAAGLAVKFGRRAGLSLALTLAAAGGLLAIAGAQTKFFPFLILGMALYGGGTTAGLQSRYAAIDLAVPERRGRTLSMVVWSTTIGAVVGPNLVGPAGRLGEWVGIEPLAGPLLFGAVAMLLAAALVWFRLRPDPLMLARRLEESPAVVGEPARPVARRRGGLRAGRDDLGQGVVLPGQWGRSGVDPHLQRAGGVRQRLLAPQIVDQPVGRHRPPLVDQQVSQQRANLRPWDTDRRAVAGPDGQRPEHPESHGRQT